MTETPSSTPPSSIQTSGKLFELVQLLKLFSDLKAFPDSFPKPGISPAQIEQEFDQFLDQFYQRYLLALGDFSTAQGTARIDKMMADATVHLKLCVDLREWVKERFVLPEDIAPVIPSSATMEDHIEKMWRYLQRQPSDIPPNSTLLPLNYPQLIPGGRFSEGYYWDSYFTALGLLATGRAQAIRDMVDNFADLIRNYGHIPNGTRTYYLSRSQPPFFAAMLDLLDKATDESASEKYFDILQQEYHYWMDFKPDGTPRTDLEAGKVVRLGSLTLNRYRDERDTPRPEAYGLDVEASLDLSPERHQKMYRDIRSAAEAGWDFTSRFMIPTQTGEYRLSSHRTTDLIPVDLNSILVSLETKLAQLAHHNPSQEKQYQEAAKARKKAIITTCWDDSAGWFFDRLISDGSSTGIWSLAGAYPLYFEILDRNDPGDRAKVARMAKHIEDKFLQPGGVVTTLIDTKQQWDWPNGWAPLQWITAIGLLNYGFEETALKIAQRFIEVARKTFNSTGKMMEKYDVCDLNRVGGGGEYPNQDGFGWTNGVVTAFQALLAGKQFWK